METRAWWRPTETLYNFIMQCAGKAQEGKKLERIDAFTQDCDFGITAYSNDFGKGVYRIKVETGAPKFPEPQNGLDWIVAEGIKKFGGSTIDFSVKKNEDILFRDGPLRVKRKRIVPFAPPVTYLVESRGIDKKDVANFRRLLTIFGASYTADNDAINVEKYAFSGRTPGWMGTAYMFACNCGLVPRIISANAFDTKRIYLAHNSLAAIEKRSMLGPLKEEDTAGIEQYLSRIARMPKGSLLGVRYEYAEPKKKEICNVPEKSLENRIKIIDPENEREELIDKVIQELGELKTK